MRNQNQVFVIALAAVALLLAAAAGIIVYKQMTGVPPVSNTGTSGTSESASTGTGPSSTGSTAFDVKTATKVPAGMTPDQMIKAYNEAVIAGKYEDAYKMLPLAKQQSYGDSNAYGEQLKAYGITSYEMGKPVESGDTMTIAATQVTPQMPITYTWTFKKVGGQWYVESREMGGSVQ